MIESLHSARRGQALVELALVLPICLWILLGIIDFGRAYYTYIAATNAAREGARWWVANPSATNGQIQARVQQEGAPQVTSFASIVPSSPATDQRRVQVQFAFTPLTPLIGSLWGGG